MGTEVRKTVILPPKMAEYVDKRLADEAARRFASPNFNQFVRDLILRDWEDHGKRGKPAKAA